MPAVLVDAVDEVALVVFSRTVAEMPAATSAATMRTTGPATRRRLTRGQGRSVASRLRLAHRGSPSVVPPFVAAAPGVGPDR